MGTHSWQRWCAVHLFATVSLVRSPLRLTEGQALPAALLAASAALVLLPAACNRATWCNFWDLYKSSRLVHMALLDVGLMAALAGACLLCVRACFASSRNTKASAALELDFAGDAHGLQLPVSPHHCNCCRLLGAFGCSHHGFGCKCLLTPSLAPSPSRHAAVLMFHDAKRRDWAPRRFVLPALAALPLAGTAAYLLARPKAYDVHGGSRRRRSVSPPSERVATRSQDRPAQM